MPQICLRWLPTDGPLDRNPLCAQTVEASLEPLLLQLKAQLSAAQHGATDIAEGADETSMEAKRAVAPDLADLPAATDQQQVLAAGAAEVEPITVA